MFECFPSPARRAGNDALAGSLFKPARIVSLLFRSNNPRLVVWCGSIVNIISFFRSIVFRFCFDLAAGFSVLRRTFSPEVTVVSRLLFHLETSVDEESFSTNSSPSNTILLRCISSQRRRDEQRSFRDEEGQTERKGGRRARPMGQTRGGTLNNILVV